MQSSIEAYLHLSACEHFLSASTTVATVAVAVFLLQRPTVTDTSLFIPSNQDRQLVKLETSCTKGKKSTIKSLWNSIQA